jgi:type IV secretory pathway TrbL component
VELLIVVAALLIGLVIFGWVLKLVKTTVKTILLVAFVGLALYLVFGIGPDTILEQLKEWTQQN